MVTEPATRKRVISMPQSERNPSWMNSPFVPFTPFGLANRSEITPPFEKRLRIVERPVSTFKWEPDLPGTLQFSAGSGYKDIEVKTPLPAAWQWRPSQRVSQDLFTPPAVKHSGEKYELVKKELKERNSWFAKLDRSIGLAENALDMVGSPAMGLKLTLAPTESYYQKYVNVKRELEDYKRVVQTVNSFIPLSSSSNSAPFSPLKNIRLRGSNLKQGPRNLYNMQREVAGEPGWSGSFLNHGMPNGVLHRTLTDDEAEPGKVVSPHSSAQLTSESGALQDQSEVHVSRDDSKAELWRALYDRTQDPAKQAQRESREKDIEDLQDLYARLQLNREEDSIRRQQERKASKKEEVGEAFIPLPIDAEEAVEDALYNGNRHELLILHEETNIEVTRAIIQCLVPGAWLNDEVINVYMQLMKERESRNPDKFLRCHFFNTFFYNKLFKDKRSYDYKSVRRWTTQKKIGYSLADCDKILVPIHQDIHWCLAVINIRDQKFEYLDSLKGRDETVLKVLAKYLVDEVKDKNNRTLDVSKWESDFPQDIPEQLNGCDCGMFMLKYADFHGRGAPLSFTQEHMEYFRRRTVYEILQNEAT